MEWAVGVRGLLLLSMGAGGGSHPHPEARSERREVRSEKEVEKRGVEGRFARVASREKEEERHPAVGDSGRGQRSGGCGRGGQGGRFLFGLLRIRGCGVEVQRLGLVGCFG